MIVKNQKRSVNFLNDRNYFKSTVSDKFRGGTKYFFSKLKIIWNLAQIWAKYLRKIDHKVWDYFSFRVKKIVYAVSDAQCTKMPTKKFFFLKEKRIDKTIKLSEYIKNLLLENTTISFIHLIDIQEISWKCQ